MNCIIVDDEPLAIRVLEKHVKGIDSINLVGTCENAIDAFNLLEKENVDLIFLDIKMPQISGIELLKSIPNPPMVILTTAYREFALEGFELDVVDYLLKPVTFERFMKSISKVNARQAQPSKIATTPYPAEAEAEYIFVRVDKRMKKIYLNDILYIESIKDYVKIVLSREVITTYLKIGYLEEKLSSKNFLRIHKSYIIGVEHIEAYSQSAIDIQGQSLPVGRYYKKMVIDHLSSGSEL